MIARPEQFFVSHPTGNTFVRALLSELDQQNRLEKYFTTIGTSQESRFISKTKTRRHIASPEPRNWVFSTHMNSRGEIGPQRSCWSLQDSHANFTGTMIRIRQNAPSTTGITGVLDSQQRMITGTYKSNVSRRSLEGHEKNAPLLFIRAFLRWSFSFRQKMLEVIR